MTDRQSRTVFAVSTGEYSDYQVHAVFERKKDAKKTADRIRGEVKKLTLYLEGNDSAITMYDLFTAHVFVSPEGKIVAPNGDVGAVRAVASQQRDADEAAHAEITVRLDHAVGPGTGGGPDERERSHDTASRAVRQRIRVQRRTRPARSRAERRRRLIL